MSFEKSGSDTAWSIEQHPEYVGDQWILPGLIHDDLIKLAALDVMTENYDRHKGNIFYDRDRDQFTGIDQGEAFKRTFRGKVFEVSLCEQAYRYFESLKGGLSCFQQEQLRKFNTILQRLSRP